MLDLMCTKLGAYLDGELNEHSQRAMQAHLETCQSCQNELEKLRHLSNLLHAAPLPEFTPASRFTSQLMLQLPRRKETSGGKRSFRVAGWAIPTTVLLGWVFIQVTLGLTTLLIIAQQIGLMGDTTAWLTIASQQTSWFAILQTIFGDSSNLTNLQFVNDIGLSLQRLVAPLAWQFALAGLYWAWLAIWWQNRQRQGRENYGE